MWLSFSVENFYGIDLGFLGIYPRTEMGLIGIITAPLVHGNIIHLVSNTLPFLILGTTLYYFYDRISRNVFLQCYFIPGVLVWLFARSSYHVGASGLIYALASFLIFLGLFRKDTRSILISIIIITFYWTLIYGILPENPKVSWESHVFGGLVGVGSAYLASKKKYVYN